MAARRGRAGSLAVALVTGAALTGCGLEQPAPHQPKAVEKAAGPVTLRVTGRKRQKIDGWGASIGSNSFLDPQARPSGLSRGQLRQLDNAVFREAGINLLRVSAPGFKFAGPGNTESGRLRRSDGRWALMRRARMAGVKFMFSASNAPASMKRTPNRLEPGAEARFARYIADNLAFAQRLKVPFYVTAIGNEIDNPDSRIIPLQMTPSEAAKIYRALAREIRRRGLRTRLAIGDTKSWDGGARFARAALSSPTVRAGARVLATHAYGGDGSRPAVARLARRNRLRLWLTEWTGAGCPQGNCRDRSDIGYALRWAREINRDLVHPGVNAWFVLRPVDDSTHGPDSGIIVRTRGRRKPFYRTKRFPILRQFTQAAPPGARRLVVSGRLRALAFRSRNRVSLVVTNLDGVGRREVVSLGRRPGRVSIRRTSARENFRRLRSRAYNGRSLAVRLPPRSVTTFVLRTAG